MLHCKDPFSGPESPISVHALKALKALHPTEGSETVPTA
jgi:hypothetical protein